MARESGSNAIWDIENALRRMEDGHYNRYRETYHRVAVMGNALQGLPLHEVYQSPAKSVLAAIQANVARAEMVSEKLLTTTEQQDCITALKAVDTALEAEPAELTLYTLCTDAASHTPALTEAFQALDAASRNICVPFVQSGFNPETAKPALDAFLGLIGTEYTFINLYERMPKHAWKPTFNRVMLDARREGLLVELRGIRKPGASCYVSDPEDDRWDIRSCVSPENAVLFKDVHQRINTMAYLMNGLTYGDFFDLPMANEKVLPHFKSRIAADKGYWFTELEKTRISEAIDAILSYLGGGNGSENLTLRDVYTNPDIPAEIMIQFQRILDVKPEICLPFMHYDWDHLEAAEAIEVFLGRNANRSLKNLYIDEPPPVKDTYTESEYRLLLEQRKANKVLLRKENNLYCYEPGDCDYELHDYCSTGLYGNCVP